MGASVSIKDILEAFEIRSDQSISCVDLDSGKVLIVSNELIEAAEQDHEPPEDLSVWEKEEFEAALRIVETNRTERLPTKWDLHDWQIMRDFTDQVPPGQIQDDLLYALRGAGAFRHFRNIVYRNQMEKFWYSYRDQALQQIAKDWCKEHGLEWVP